MVYPQYIGIEIKASIDKVVLGIPFLIGADQEGGITIAYMTGIYRVENGRPVFAILTRDPAESISFIHN